MAIGDSNELDDLSVLAESLRQRQMRREMETPAASNPLRDVLVGVGSLGYGLGTGQSAPALAQNIIGSARQRDDNLRRQAALEEQQDLGILSKHLQQKAQLRAKEVADVIGHQRALERIDRANQYKLNAEPAKEAKESKRDKNALRKEIVSNPATKQMQEVDSAYRKIIAASEKPSAPGDMSMIFAYMKMLDPGSTVREGEFANAQNAASIPDRVRNLYNKAQSGELLNPEQRAEFVNQASNVYKSQFDSYNAFLDLYRDMAAESGYDVKDISPRFSGLSLKKQSQPISPEGRVRVIRPDGKVGSIPKSNLGKLPAGWKVAE